MFYTVADLGVLVRIERDFKIVAKTKTDWTFKAGCVSGDDVRVFEVTFAQCKLKWPGEDVEERSPFWSMR